MIREMIGEICNFTQTTAAKRQMTTDFMCLLSIEPYAKTISLVTFLIADH